MKVLVVDDDVIQRMLLVDLLRRYEKIEIVEAADGIPAWEEVQNGLCPVLCCCDMLMPGMSGIELLQRFKSRTALADVPFIFITASLDRKTIENAISSCATDYILKPVNFTKARTSLDRIFRTVYEKYSESPSATQKRLRIPAERLIDYYSTLKQQLAITRPPIHQQLTTGEILPAGNALSSLSTACITLGLWHAAKMIKCVHALQAELIDRVLKDIEAIVDEQMLDARKEFGIREPPKPPQEEALVPHGENIAAPA